MKTIWSAIAAMVLVVALIVPAAAEEKKQDRPGGVMVEAVSITATVEAIDYKTRQVTLKGPKGGLTTFIAGDEVKRLNDVKKGDQVTFNYTEGIAIDVQKATEAPKMIETQSIQRAKPTEKPGGTVETVGFLTARVEEIDHKTRKVKLSLPEGQNLNFTVGDQVQRLNEVKKGDEVVVQYMQKLTIKVTTPKSK
jgi:Cu/Ag efflux protein CusF